MIEVRRGPAIASRVASSVWSPLMQNCVCSQRCTIFSRSFSFGEHAVVDERIVRRVA